MSKLLKKLRLEEEAHREEGGWSNTVIANTFMEAAERISTLEALTDQLAEALRNIARWDALTLRPDGHGAFLADAPWARSVIVPALRAYEADKEAHRGRD